MDKEIAGKYINSGKILKECQEEAKKLLKPGVKLLLVAEKIESLIKKSGAKPAFPVNLSFNSDAAHYTPSVNDETIFRETDVVKVDIGVHTDGFIADAAFTLDLSGKAKEMIKVNEKALEEALKISEVGTTLGEIGEVIESTIREAGFKPVENLSGHGLDEFTQHAHPSIPNIATGSTKKLEDNHAYAIEPFVSTGRGSITEAAQCEIFMLDELRPVRNPAARKIIEFVQEEFSTLPFAERWIENGLHLGDFTRKTALKQLLQAKVLSAYPVLKEEKNAVVTQAETSFILFEGKKTRLV